jgi:hypothetical protein
MYRRFAIVPFVACCLAPAPASAATIFFDGFSPAQQPGWSFASPSAGFMGELNNNTNVSGVTLTHAAPVADPGATLGFDLLGFRSLDHFNCCVDILTLTINGTTMFTGAWSADVSNTTGPFGFNFNPSGASFTLLFNDASGPGRANFGFRFLVPFALLAGPNTYAWSYTPLQSQGDEAWGLDNVSIDSSAVPEPASLLLVTAGLLGLAGRQLSRARR